VALAQLARGKFTLRRPDPQADQHVKGSQEKLEVSRTFNHLFKQM